MKNYRKLNGRWVNASVAKLPSPQPVDIALHVSLSIPLNVQIHYRNNVIYFFEFVKIPKKK